jgi:hypothetical protein
MKNLIIEKTPSTPSIQFMESGRLLLEGRSLPENTVKFYGPLIDWATGLTAPLVNMTVNLDYINSSSTKKLLELLKVLDANYNIKELCIEWFYEVDDEDILENGQIFEELLRKARFRYHEYSHAA